MLGRAAKAVACFERALDLFAHNPGTGHPVYSHCLAEYGWATWLLGETEASPRRLAGARDALANHLGPNHLGPNHHLVGQFTVKLSLIYAAKGDRAAAVAEQQRAVDAFLTCLGAGAPRTQEALARLAQLRQSGDTGLA